MVKETRIVFTNVDKEAETIGYLQIIITSKTTYNYEISYEDDYPFPYLIKFNDRAENLGKYLNEEDREKVQKNFNQDVWKNGSQIFRINLFKDNIVS